VPRNDLHPVKQTRNHIPAWYFDDHVIGMMKIQVRSLNIQVLKNAHGVKIAEINLSNILLKKLSKD
jgi:hypothetical protein